MLTTRINESRPHRVALRLAFGAALTLMLAAALMAFGGIGYAGAAVQQVGKLAQGLNPQQQKGDNPGDEAEDGEDGEDGETERGGEPDDDQYKEERKQCRRAEQQRHKNVRRDIKQDYAACQRVEKNRHRQAVKACGNNKACRDAEDALHKANVRACKEERERREREEQERHERAKEACDQIGR